jgi:3-deoxy-D-manno-octulosonate 8-phosphate phosphatase KdsC-like HAD superfamily phosphatase
MHSVAAIASLLQLVDECLADENIVIDDQDRAISQHEVRDMGFGAQMLQLFQSYLCNIL